MPDFDSPVANIPGYPDARKLFDYLMKSSLSFWPEGFVCQFDDGSHFVLPKAMFKRDRNKTADVPHRVEIIDKRHPNQGARSTVWDILATLTETGYKPAGYKGKSRLVKIEYLKNEKDQDTREYDMLKEAGHISVKPRLHIIQDNKRFQLMVMEKKPGDNLSNLLDKDRANNFQDYTIVERLRLTESLLSALELQAHNLTIIHRDIKPANIQVARLNDLKELFNVNLVDYGYAVYVDGLDGMSPGTPWYAAPELSTDESKYQTDKLDIYSMGILLLELWGEDNEDSDYEFDPVTKELKNLCNKTVPDLLGFEPIKAQIIEAILKMLDLDPTERPAAEESRKEFTSIRKQVKALMKAQKPADVNPETSNVSEQIASSSLNPAPQPSTRTKRMNWHDGTRNQFFSEEDGSKKRARASAKQTDRRDDLPLNRHSY
jgi:serine/threonine protein kinase